MKETFTVSKYVTIWHCDENGTKGTVFMEKAQMRRKISVAKNLIVRTVEPVPTEIDLGVVETGINYHKRSCVDVKTDRGWFHVAYNEGLTWLLDDSLGFVDLLDD